MNELLGVQLHVLYGCAELQILQLVVWSALKVAQSYYQKVGEHIFESIIGKEKVLKCESTFVIKYT